MGSSASRMDTWPSWPLFPSHSTASKTPHAQAHTSAQQRGTEAAHLTLLSNLDLDELEGYTREQVREWKRAVLAEQFSIQSAYDTATCRLERRVKALEADGRQLRGERKAAWRELEKLNRGLDAARRQEAGARRALEHVVEREDAWVHVLVLCHKARAWLVEVREEAYDRASTNLWAGVVVVYVDLGVALVCLGVAWVCGALRMAWEIGVSIHRTYLSSLELVVVARRIVACAE